MRAGVNLSLLLLTGLLVASPSFADEFAGSGGQAFGDEALAAGVHAVAVRPVEDNSHLPEAAPHALPQWNADAQDVGDQLPVIAAAPVNLDVEHGFHDVETTGALKTAAARASAEQQSAKPQDGKAEPASPAVLASSAPPAQELNAAPPAAAEMTGPELPDAEIAKLILRKLAGRKGKLDESLAQFYETRAFRPLWIEGESLKASVKNGLSTLGHAADHGLKPASYTVSLKLATLDERAESEIELSRALLKYARDARGARINPRKISSLVTAEPTLPEATEALAMLASASDLGAALESFQPQQSGYKALQKKLVELRQTTPIDADAKAASANDRLEKDIIANMERWRWMPLSLGDAHVFVNVPDYELKVVRDGRIVHQTKVIVGKPQTPTPIFSHAMEYLIVNPYWNIPPSIALKEMLPQLRSDPYALQRKGFEIVRGGKTVDPSGVDWTGSIKNIRIRQPPGERNALGYIKFMFPNDHSVYLHDTPSRGLFAKSTRAFSHGCVRVFEPFALAEILLDHQNGLTERQLRNMIGSGERYIYLQNKIPVHIAYFTTFIDETGAIQTRPDIYGHNAKVKAALQLAD